MRIIVSCPVQGEAFRPSEAERQSGIRFSEKSEVGELGKSGRYPGQPQPYGYGSLGIEIRGNDLEEPLQRFLDQVRRGAPFWQTLGAESLIVQIDVFYDHQCNLEFSESIIAALHDLRVPVAISCYREVNEEA